MLNSFIVKYILQNNSFVCRKEKEDLELETSELKQKLNLKNTEFISLQQEFQEKAALLSLNELRIQQVILCLIILEDRNLIPKLILIKNILFK